jgi:hypothetical protein
MMMMMKEHVEMDAEVGATDDAEVNPEENGEAQPGHHAGRTRWNKGHAEAQVTEAHTAVNFDWLAAAVRCEIGR